MQYYICTYSPVCVPGLSNVEFHCGRAEDVFPNVLGAVVSPNVTAIVDPPRAGLRKSAAPTVDMSRMLFFIYCCCCFLFFFWTIDSKVILAIRRAEHLKRLVYVSCNAKAAMNNFVE